MLEQAIQRGSRSLLLALRSGSLVDPRLRASKEILFHLPF